MSLFPFHTTTTAVAIPQPQATAKMSSLSTVEARLPPGFRFHPRDEELVCEYLMKWVMGCPHQTPFLIEVDLNKCEPWDIPENARVGGKNWYFYSLRDRKYASGIRANRATKSGYWKATGKDRPVFQKETLVGMRKTLVFHGGRAPKGRKTDWVMHEFRLEGALEPGPKTPYFVKKDWVVCRVFHKKTSQETGILRYEESPTTSVPEYINDQDEQVPCLSIFTANQTIPRTPKIFPSRIIPSTSTGGTLPHSGIISSVVNDGIIFKASPSFGEGSSDSYLSQLAFNHFHFSE